ncbi:MAG: FISUMP domain-containing protein [Salinivirgaceae bacterium]
MKLDSNRLFLMALASTLFLLIACEDDDANPATGEPTNSAPTCTITSPEGGAEFTQGDTITIAVEALDEDENIQEVKFYVNDTEIGSVSSFPYRFDWYTSEEEPDSYTVKAEAIDEQQAKAIDETTLAIVTSGSAPVATFEVDQTNIAEGEPVSFTDQSANDPTSWSWDFGDGSTSNEASPSHTYNSVGSYSIELTVSNDYGSHTETKTDFIRVLTGTVTDVDGNDYNTVLIGDQVWMAENLKTTTYNDGTAINLVENSLYWENNTNGAYCWYNNDEATYADTHGALYNWYAVNTGNLCPDGWHVPTDEEWTALERFIASDGHNGTEGKALKSTTGWEYNGNGTDNYGFNALPEGARNETGPFYDFGNNCYWWSATDTTSSSAIKRGLLFDNDRVYKTDGSIRDGVSVRCLVNN